MTKTQSRLHELYHTVTNPHESAGQRRAAAQAMLSIKQRHKQDWASWELPGRVDYNIQRAILCMPVEVPPLHPTQQIEERMARRVSARIYKALRAFVLAMREPVTV